MPYPKILGLMAMPRPVIRFLSRYSEGLRLSTEHGPVSGMLVEYACTNEAQGAGRLGRWIDRRFLDSRAWQGVRRRTETTKDAVLDIIERRRAARAPTMILDVASGTARYLRTLARDHGGEDLFVACQDRNPREVMFGRQLVQAEGLPRFTFSVGDAMDESSYLTSRDPDVVLAVGLFAILPNDDQVRTVMQLGFRHLNCGGYFLCTTLAKCQRGEKHWDIDAYAASTTARSPDTIAGWMREVGFCDIEQRFSQPQGTLLIGQKGYVAVGQMR